MFHPKNWNYQLPHVKDQPLRIEPEGVIAQSDVVTTEEGNVTV
jgi:hypothetical protein